MPIFEFKCEACGKVFEELVSLDKIDSVSCGCGHKKVQRIPSTFSSKVKEKSTPCKIADNCAANSGGVPPCHGGGCAFHGQ